MKHLFIYAITTLLCLPLFSQTLQNNLKKHIEHLASNALEGRLSGTKGDSLAAQYIKDQFSKINGIELLGDNGLQHFKFQRVVQKDSTPVEFNTANVVAILKAEKKNNREGKHIIVGAHFDHEGMKDGVIYPGADDNASGTAYLIELAKRYAKQRNSLKYDIVFIAFAAEEIGILGSSHYANNPLIPLKDAKAMINFDMLGRMNNKGLTIRGLGTSKQAVPVVNSLKNRDEIDLIWEFRGNGPTDYSSFYMQNIPSFSFSTRIHGDYHSPRDKADKINYEGILIADRYINQLIDAILNPKVKLNVKKVYEH